MLPYIHSENEKNDTNFEARLLTQDDYKGLPLSMKISGHVAVMNISLSWNL